MELNELRIGNWIIDEIGRNVKVESISEWGINLVPGFGWDISWRPVQLTEEWLLKFGFFKYNNAYVLEKPNENIMNFKFSIWSDFTYNSSEFPVELKYVHQLQNLYFALTGTHLKLK